ALLRPGNSPDKRGSLGVQTRLELVSGGQVVEGRGARLVPDGTSEEVFQVAEKIVTNAQNAPEPGWKPYDGSRNRNRYWLIKNILDNEYSGVRQFVYLYHLRGLDRMESDITRARTDIYESLRQLQEVYRRRPDPFMYYMTIILEAKADEIVNIFSEAFPEEKNRVVQILTEIDPANESKYQKILTASG
ncbi:MAG: type IX secretion component PorD family protein, partial [bacterium]